VTDSVAGNAGAALSSGAQHWYDKRSLTPTAVAFVRPTSAFAVLTGEFDQWIVAIGHVGDYTRHEFPHVPGIWERPGRVVPNTNP